LFATKQAMVLVGISVPKKVVPMLQMANLEGSPGKIIGDDTSILYTLEITDRDVHGRGFRLEI